MFQTFISVFNQLDAQNLFHNKFISCLYMFRAHVLIIRRSKLHYTASGIITPIGGRLVHVWSHLSQYLTNFMHKICFTISFISCLYMFRAHVLIIRKSKLHYTASGIITPIGGRTYKFCASSWLNTEINILRCTVNKTSKKCFGQFR